MKLLRPLFCLAAVLSISLCAGETDQETARQREYEGIQKEMEALRPSQDAQQEEVLTFVEAAKEKFGGFAAKYKKTPEGFEAGSLVASMLTQLQHPEAVKYAELAVEAAPDAGVDVKKVAMCWIMVAQGRLMKRDPDGCQAALEKIKTLDAAMYEKISPQFEEMSTRIRGQLAIAKLLAPGNKPFEIKAKDIDGKDFELADWKGKVVLIDFWATWCGPCIGELPNVQKIYDDNHGKGLEVIGISLDKDEGELRSGIQQLGIKWRILSDYKAWESAIPTQWGVGSIPATFVIDRKGVIRYVSVYGPELREAIDKLIAE